MNPKSKARMEELAIKECVIDDEGILRQVGVFQPWYRKGYEAGLSDPDANWEKYEELKRDAMDLVDFWKPINDGMNWHFGSTEKVTINDMIRLKEAFERFKEKYGSKV